MNLKQLALLVIVAATNITAQCSYGCGTNDYYNSDPTKYPCYKPDVSNDYKFYVCWGSSEWHMECPLTVSGTPLKWNQVKWTCDW